ncbi:MAG: sugar porter family MFS transporter [Candidatus Hydrogenedentes bacterium]|nr:sugar porter family MFS transporter [Candidatus Hydrogenedentota bacterium]
MAKTTLGTAGKGPVSNLYLYFVAVTAAVGGFLFGYDLSIITGAMLYLEKYFAGANLGLLTSSAVFGCILGSFASVWAADKFGRRNSLYVAAGLFLVSAIWCSLVTSAIEFDVARAIGGIGVGLATGISPMYIAEISPARMRGRMVVVNQLSIVVGIVMSIVVALLLSYGGHWRWMFASAAVPSLALAIGLLFVPRSPRWLASKGLDKEALAVLARINGAARADEELAEIKAELGQETGSFRDLGQPGIRYALLVACILMIFQQVNGVNMILIYASKILVEAGIGSVSNALLNSLYVYFLIFFCTIVSFWLVAKSPRRLILMAGTTGMALGHLIMAYSFFTNSSTWIVLLAMLVAAGSFTLSLAPVGWVVVSEIFPNRVRGKCMGIVTFCLFTSSFVVTWAFPNVTDYFQQSFGNRGGAYLLFAGICMACVAFVWRFIPETKDLTLEEISGFWLGQTKRAPVVEAVRPEVIR